VLADEAVIAGSATGYVDTLRFSYRVVALVARRPPEPDPVLADPVIAFIDGVVEAERVLL
jgi:hypothetical protein